MATDGAVSGSSVAAVGPPRTVPDADADALDVFDTFPAAGPVGVPAPHPTTGPATVPDPGVAHDSLGLPTPVTDEDRMRFGVLLDRAAERGLLDPYEYDTRLRSLAEATSVEEMRSIVTELPAFDPSVLVAARTSGRRAPRRAPGLGGGGGSTRWVVLVAVAVVLVVTMAVAAVYAAHVARAHEVHQGLGVLARSVSRPRP
jgi:hypothetical protein